MKKLMMTMTLIPLMTLAVPLRWPAAYRTAFGESDLRIIRQGEGWSIPVVMDPGGANGAQRLYEGLQADDYAAPSCPYLREGYSFAGWNYYSCCYVGRIEDIPFYSKGVSFGGLAGLKQPGELIDVCGLSALVATWEKVPFSGYRVRFDANGGECAEESRDVAKGKGIGTLPEPTRSRYKFLGWYSLPEGGTKISASTKITYDVTCYAHWQFDGSAAVLVGVAEECEGLGTVSGGNKMFKAGAKVSLKATARKGAAFAYWYDDENGVVSTSSSYSFSASGFESNLTAYFIRAEEDWLCVRGDGDLRLDVGEILSEERYLFDISSGSAATITVKGLPAGIKAVIHAEHGEYWVTCSGKPTREGVYWVTCTAKNGNGYQSSETVKLLVGNVDDSEWWVYDWEERGEYLGTWMLEWDGLSGRQTLESGQYFDTDVDVDGYTVQVGAKKLTMSGLPSGLKYEYRQGDCCGDFLRVYGCPTKAGHYDVKITATYPNGTSRKVSKSIYVKDSGSRYLAVRCGNGYEDRGTVTGSGVYACGSSVKLSAKAKKGYYFAGWYADPECRSGCCGEDEWRVYMASGDYRKASDTYSFVKSSNAEDYYRDAYEDGFVRCLYAKFLSKEEDYADVSVWTRDGEYYYAEGGDRVEYDDEWREATWLVRATPTSWEDNWGECFFRVESGTLPTVYVSGLPSGCKWDKKTNRLYFPKQPSKPGISKVTIKVKNLSGLTKSQTLYVKVPNLRSDIFSELDYENDYHAIRGVSYGYCLCDEACHYWCEQGWKVTASGLPPGMRFVQNKYAPEGSIEGIPTKPGAYTVTFTARNGKLTEKATVTFIVDELPDYAVGKFNGLMKDGDDSIGTFSLTATSAGKLSVSMTMEDGTKKSYSASSWKCACDGTYSCRFIKRASKGSLEEIYFEVQPGLGWDQCQLYGSAWNLEMSNYCVEEVRVVAQRNPFGRVGKEYENVEAHLVAAELASCGKIGVWAVDRGYGEYEFAYPDCDPASCGLKPDLTFTVAVDGTVKVAGKVDGKSISASSVLRIIEDQPMADFCLYVKATPIWIHVDFHNGDDANCAVSGTMKFF